MSASTSQNKDFIEVKIEDPEIKDESKDEGDEKMMPSKYFAIKFKLQMYIIENLNKEGLVTENNPELKNNLKSDNDTDLEDDKKTSYRELSSAPTAFKFTDKQLNLIKNEHENILKWSIAVSDKLTSLPKFRLLTISCINLKDIKYYKGNPTGIHPIGTLNHGFTFVFMINDDYSISNIEELPIEYGGIVKLFSKNDKITNQNVEKDNDKQIIDKTSQNDGHLLIILTLSGIHKYHINMKNKFINISEEYDKACHDAYDTICG
ncbi:12211_t:CDS:2, partial [Dentiscutata erythropus]